MATVVVALIERLQEADVHGVLGDAPPELSFSPNPPVTTERRIPRLASALDGCGVAGGSTPPVSSPYRRGISHSVFVTSETVKDLMAALASSETTTEEEADQVSYEDGVNRLRCILEARRATVDTCSHAYKELVRLERVLDNDLHANLSRQAQRGYILLDTLWEMHDAASFFKFPVSDAIALNYAKVVHPSKHMSLSDMYRKLRNGHYTQKGSNGDEPGDGALLRDLQSIVDCSTTYNGRESDITGLAVKLKSAAVHILSGRDSGPTSDGSIFYVPFDPPTQPIVPLARTVGGRRGGGADTEDGSRPATPAAPSENGTRKGLSLALSVGTRRTRAAAAAEEAAAAAAAETAEDVDEPIVAGPSKRRGRPPGKAEATNTKRKEDELESKKKKRSSVRVGKKDTSETTATAPLAADASVVEALLATVSRLQEELTSTKKAAEAATKLVATAAATGKNRAAARVEKPSSARKGQVRGKKDGLVDSCSSSSSSSESSPSSSDADASSSGEGEPRRATTGRPQRKRALEAVRRLAAEEERKKKNGKNHQPPEGSGRPKRAHPVPAPSGGKSSGKKRLSLEEQDKAMHLLEAVIAENEAFLARQAGLQTTQGGAGGGVGCDKEAVALRMKEVLELERRLAAAEKGTAFD